MMGGEPGDVEQARKRMEAPLERTDYHDGIAITGNLLGERRRKDLLRRFTPTPYSVDLLVMGRTVRLETNSLTVAENALEFFARHQGASPGDPQFLWRLVSQEDPQMERAGVALSAFSDRGLRFANIGQRSFLAVDLEAREGLGFLAEPLVEREPKLHCRSVFDTLFCMSAG